MRPEALKILDADVPIGVPANKAFYAELAVNPLIKASMDNARAGEPIPNIPEVGRFWTAMDAALEAITNGLQSPKDALDGASGRMRLKTGKVSDPTDMNASTTASVTHRQAYSQLPAWPT